MLRENEPTPANDADDAAGARRAEGGLADAADPAPAGSPAPAPAAGIDGDDDYIDDGVRETAAKVHRVPRMGSFMAAGALAGAIIVLILTFAFPENPTFTRLQVFGFLAAFTVPVTLAIGGFIGYLAGRRTAKRTVDARLIRADELEARGRDD